MEIEGDHCHSQFIGFAICYDYGFPKFWHTLNKITIFNLGETWEEVFCFYSDYRDCRYGVYGYGNDISILINHSTGKVYYDGGLNKFCTLTDYTEISEDETITIWEVNDYSGPHDVSCMCATPTLISVTNYNNHPKVTWSHADDPNGSYSYEV